MEDVDVIDNVFNFVFSPMLSNDKQMWSCDLCFKCSCHVPTWWPQCLVHSLAAIKTCLNSDMAADM